MRWVLVFGLFIMTISGVACSNDEEPDTYNRGGPLPATSTPTPTPGPADTHKLKGVEFNYDEQWEDAIAEFDAALELDPGMADAHFGRAFAYDELANFEEAIISYGDSIKFNSENI